MCHTCTNDHPSHAPRCNERFRRADKTERCSPNRYKDKQTNFITYAINPSQTHIAGSFEQYPPWLSGAVDPKDTSTPATSQYSDAGATESGGH